MSLKIKVVQTETVESSSSLQLHRRNDKVVVFSSSNLILFNRLTKEKEENLAEMSRLRLEHDKNLREIRHRHHEEQVKSEEKMRKEISLLRKELSGVLSLVS